MRERVRISGLEDLEPQGILLRLLLGATLKVFQMTVVLDGHYFADLMVGQTPPHSMQLQQLARLQLPFLRSRQIQSLIYLKPQRRAAVTLLQTEEPQ